MKLKDIVSPRIAILVIALLVSLLAINPSITSEGGVIIKEISSNSTLIGAGLIPPQEDIQPRSYERIIDINNIKITNIEDYQSVINNLQEGEIITITTNKQQYNPIQYSTDIGLIVDKAPSTNLRKGLELIGGTRVVLEPEGEITEQDLDNAKDSLDFRLNVYGLSDIDIKKASDLSGNKFIVIEIAGASQDEVRRLVGQQGKFEAKINDETVFVGGENDITFVCRNDGTCSGITSCSPTNEGNSCRFEFVIQLSEKAAKRHSEITANIPLNTTHTGARVLEKPLELYLDDKLVDTLQIDASLQGKETSSILISGPGFGADESLALENALESMNQLQTVMITGSLPVKLEISKIDTISPTLGNAFVKNAFIAGLLAIASVFIVIFIRYKTLKISIAMLIAILSELFIILGLAALFRYNLDLAAIAGIIAAVGTGVDDQIVIADEIIKGGLSHYNWKEKVKRAFYIIFVAFFTTVAAMTPLLWAGIGLLKGFALATIAGVTVGVLITRPAFAKIVELLVSN